MQDFVNTADIEVGIDDMRTPERLVAFAAAHDLPASTYTDADVDSCRRVRELLRDVCQSHAGVDFTGTGELKALLARGALSVQVNESGHASVVPADGLSGADLLFAYLAATIVTAQAEGTWPRLKASAADSCRWVYYDKSPAGRSRWCTMSICGARNKMRAYRQRSAG